MMSNSVEKLRKLDSGMIVVLLGAALLLFMVLAGLTIGLGIIASIRLSAQNIANAAALGGIEEWVTTSSSVGNVDRADRVLARVGAVVARGKPPGFFADAANPFGDARFSWSAESDDAGVEVTFGRFYPIDPTLEDPGPCEDFPCFVKYPNATNTQLGNGSAVVNAVQVKVSTPTSNPILAPFTNVFGSGAFDIEVTATATLVQRCTSMLVDLSGSSFIDTHVPVANAMGAPAPFPVVLSTNPGGNSGAFAFNYYYDQSSGGLGALPSINCRTFNVGGGINLNDPASIFWCNMRPSRAGARPWDNESFPGLPGDLDPWPSASPHPTDVDPEVESAVTSYGRTHFRDDFRPNQSAFYGNQLFLIDEYVDDLYKGPEPFTSYMQGFNAALRTLQNQQTALDSVSLRGFAGKPINSIPPFLTGGGGISLTEDLGYMIQITNLENRGTFQRNATGNVVENSPELHPNFVDHGFFSVPLTSGNIIASSTNLVEVLDLVIEDLTTTCPANAKKQIILATDGVASCSFETHLSSTERDDSPAPDNSPRRVCTGSGDPLGYANYLLAEQQLIGEDGYSIPGSTQSGLPELAGSGATYPSIVERLKNEQIAVTVLMAGSYVEPNFRNFLNASTAEGVTAWNPGTPPSEAFEFLPYAKALAFGFTGLNAEYPSREYVNAVSSTPSGSGNVDEDAFNNLGSSGYVFRRPNGSLSRLVMKSGGLWCPLMARDPDNSCYDASGNMASSCRGAIQTRSTLDVSSSILAAQCASAAVGHNPYLLAEPFEECENSGSAGSPSCPA